MKNFKLFLGITGILVCFIFPGRVIADHLSGGEITWTCVGHDSFMIKMVLYRDCNGAYIWSDPIHFSCKSSGALITSKTLQAPSGVDITPTCNSSCNRCKNPTCSFPYGIEQYTFTGLVVLSGAVSCCEINIDIYTCCRSLSITTGAANQNLELTALMNRCLSPCDNSPSFSNPPITIICIGQDCVFDYGISDPDLDSSSGLLDSLVYAWVKPLSVNGTPTYWISPYDYDKPIKFWGFPTTTSLFPRGFHLDPVTGEISFRPLNTEQTIMCLSVSEYRKGVKIGEVRRDIMVIIINCPNNHAPALEPAVYYKEVCVGNPVTFTINTSDPDLYDTLTISWNHGIKGASWTDSNGLRKHPSGTFTWTPTKNQARSLPYSFSVMVKDNACPIPSYFQHTYQVLVKSDIEADISITDSCGGNFYLNAHALIGAGPVFTWTRDSLPEKFSYTGAIVHHRFSAPGSYPFTMKMTAQGCTKIYQDTITVGSFFHVQLPNDTGVCEGTIINITGKYSGEKGKVKMSWNTSLNDTTDQVTIRITKNTLLIFIASDTSGCTVIDSMMINAIKPLIKIDSLPLLCENDSVLNLDNYVTVDGNYRPGKGKWSCPKSGVINAGQIDPKVAGHGTFKVKYEYTDSLTGCYNSDSNYITVHSLPIIKIDSLPSLCENDSAIQLDNFVTVNGNHKPGAGKWTGMGITSPDIFDPKTVTPATIYQVTYTFTDTMTGCQNSGYGLITVNSSPHAFFGAAPVSGNLPLNVNFKDSSYISSGTIQKYLWDFGNGDISTLKNPNYTYASPGIYTIRLIVSNHGCADTFIRKNYIKIIPTSITDHVSSETISIIPNPALNYTIISVNGSSTKIESVVLTNSLGKTILYFNKISDKELIINRIGIEKGIYFLKIKLPDNTIVYRKVLFE